MTTKTKEVQRLDALDKLAAADPREIIALMLWQNRMKNPELSIMITEKDLTGWSNCTSYLKVTPKVKIIRPQGRPASPSRPATATRSAIPGYAAEPPRPYVLVQIVDQAGDSIRPVEDNEQDYDRARRADKRLKAKDQARDLAAGLKAQVASGTFSSDSINAVCEALGLLASDE